MCVCVCFGLIKRFIYLFLLVDLSEYGTAETEQLNVFLLVYYSSEKFFVYKKRTMLLGYFFFCGFCWRASVVCEVVLQWLRACLDFRLDCLKILFLNPVCMIFGF